MVFIDHKGNIRIKIVVYGPSRSGKTTLMKKIAEQVKDVWKAKVMSIEDVEGQTLFFDFAPFKYKDRPLAIDLFSVPGKFIHKHQRETILRGADLVIFVADYSDDREEANISSLEELNSLVKVNTPVIIAINKYDLVYRLDREKFIRRIPRDLNVKAVIDISAKMNYNIEKVFETAFKTAVESITVQ